MSVTPEGSVPVKLKVGAGNPEAVTWKEPALPTVNAVLPALTITGGVGVGDGVTPTVAEARLGPWALKAVTEQV